MHQASPVPDKPVWGKAARWVPGILALAALAVAVSHLGELTHFLELARQARPSWLILAGLLQMGTYVCVAGVWYLALRAAGERGSMLLLTPLGLAKLFTDQAVPSGGMSGSALFIAALNRRGVPGQVCMATLLLGMVSYYAAYLIAAVAALLIFYFYHALHAWIVVVVMVFSLVAVGIPAGALWLRSFGKRTPPAWMMRMPGLTRLLETVAGSPAELLRRPSLMAAGVLLQGMVILLDAATLVVMLRTVGLHTSPFAAFPVFVLATMVATLSMIPLGLGTFEVTCVTMLGVTGVPIEAAFTATLLLRGFTLWLPMLPGMWTARWVLR